MIKPKNIRLLFLTTVLLVLVVYISITARINVFIMVTMISAGIICCFCLPLIKRKRLKYALTAIFLIVFIILLGSFIIMSLADNTLFHPNQNIGAYNSNRQNSELTEITIDNGDMKLSGWMRKNGEGKSPLIIYFGGNAECSAEAFNYFSTSSRWSAFEPYSFMMIDYPGYGLSDSSPTNKSIFKMAEQAYDYAVSRDDVDENNIVIMGYSIGSGVATYISSERSVSGLILLAPYDEGRSLYNNFINIFHGPLKLLVKNEFFSMKYAPKINVTPLIIASKADEVVPYRLSVNLSKYFANEPQFYTYENISHNEFWINEQTYEMITAYLSQIN